MASWSGKSQGSVLGYQIIYYLMKYIGLGFAYFILRFVSLYFLIFSFHATQCQYYYFRKRLKKGFFETIFLLYQNYFHFAQILTDRVYFIAGLPARFTFDFEGENYLEAILKKGKGAFLISAHAGNWEIAGFLLKRLNTNVNIVLFDGEQEKIKNFLDGVKGKVHFKVIAIVKNSIEHIYQINAALANNEVVCLHADRYELGNLSHEANFLGAPAKFPLGPFVLASQLEVPVSFVYAMKDNAKHYHFYASPPLELTGSNNKSERINNAKYILQEYVYSLEKILNRYPTQWFNYYKFWNN